MNQFKRIIALIVFASTTLLTACGGGGGGGSTPGGSSQPSTPAQPGTVDPNSTLTGKAIDGYLVGARVCIDMNDNGVCDNGEPSTRTDYDGNYGLMMDPSYLGKKLLVVIQPDTQDRSRPNYRFPAQIMLSAVLTTDPVQHITPFTTLVTAKMETGMSRADAAKAVAAVVGNEVDIFGDFVLAGRRDVLTTAQTIVDKAATFSINGRLSHDMMRAVANAIVDKGSITDVKQEDVDAANTKHVYSADVDAEAALKGGVQSYDSTQSVNGVSVPVRSSVQLTGDQLTTVREKFVSNNWTAVQPTDFTTSAGEYHLKADGTWGPFQSAASLAQPVTVAKTNRANILTSKDAVTGITTTYEYRVGDVSNQSFSDVMKGWLDSALSNGLVGNFSANSQAYKLSAYQDYDQMVLKSDTRLCSIANPPITEDGVQHCNWQGLSGFEYKAVAAANGVLFPVGQSKLMLAYHGAAEFRNSQDQILTTPGKVTWQYYGRNADIIIVDIALSELPKIDLYDEDIIRRGGKLIVALHNGRLKDGLMLPKGRVETSSLQFGAAQFDQVFAKIRQFLNV